jgi:acyl-CoA thioesterase
MKISSTQFLNLGHPVDTHRWQLPITADLTGGRGSLFGGAGLAAGIVALEQATEKPVMWATGQYLSIVQQPVTLDLEVSLPAIGRNVSQGRVVGHLGDKEIITILGAVGERSDASSGMWLSCPEAARPEDCPLVVRHHDSASMHDHVEIRLVSGMFGFSGAGEPRDDGRSLLWARMPKVEHDAGALAIIADYMPSALGSALGKIMYCTSIDNTIRYANRDMTDWVLCDNRMEFVGNGFGYGTMHMWSEQGKLLATASQTMIVRTPEAE